jgi:predicted HicB family RNase H-like nuclease
MIKQPIKESDKLLVVRISSELHKKVKIKSINTGKSIRRVMIELLNNYINE